MKLSVKKINPLKWPLKFRIIALIVIIGLGIGIWQFTKNSAKIETAQIQTIQISRSDLEQTLELSGQVEQSNLISVITKASGVVSQVYVTDSEDVKAGDKLAEII